ncbi:hypothetical protein Taro_016600 [Colocasia esculenta]|uniref:Hydroxyproline-rich glycoprotein family protein n=1 Tax=Colocasia esculenta TaxID=4460 RepID=A0A843UWQ0_COLES|nr:hypothetical protein [Colocasia esculenta]
MMGAAHQQPPPPPQQQHQFMPPSYEAAPTSSSSRPMLGFPLGTALLLLVIFCLSGVLSCCYHWDKIQALRRRALGLGEGEPADEENGGGDGGVDPAAGIPPSNESLPVIMPGDRIPKFMAWPCPCDHLPSFAAPPRASDEPPPPDQVDKLATVEGLSSPAPAPPSAALSCATTHTAIT